MLTGTQFLFMPFEGERILDTGEIETCGTSWEGVTT